MKVAILHQALGRFGGAEKACILHSIHLKKCGLDVELFMGGHDVPDEWRRWATSELLVNPLPLGPPQILGNLRELWRSVRSLASFDVIFVYYFIDPLLLFYVAKFSKKKVFWYCGEPLGVILEEKLSEIKHGSPTPKVTPTTVKTYGRTLTTVLLSGPSFPVSIKILRYLDKKTVQSLYKIAANSNYTATVLKRLYDLEREPSVIYPGVDTNLYPKIQHGELGNSILAVGAMVPMKNYATLVTAFSLLPPQAKSEVKLILVGDGPDRQNIESLISSLGLQANVSIRANISEVELYEHYRNCMFVVHIALYEPFGLIPAEAALFGKTAIVTNLGGTKEIVLDRETGIIVNPRNTEEIANVMWQLIQDESYTQELGRKARQRVMAEFTMEKSSQSLVRFLTNG